MRPKVGLSADRPATAARGRIYVASDTDEAWIHDGFEWILTSAPNVPAFSWGDEPPADPETDDIWFDTDP